MSLCFVEAFEQKKAGKIPEEAYLDQLLAHCQGWISVEHEGDDDTPWSPKKKNLLETDPFGYAIWLWSRATQLDNKDTTPFKQTLLAYHATSTDDLRDKLDSLNAEDGSHIEVAVAHRALKECHRDVLKFCLERRFSWSGSFFDAANQFEKEKRDQDICALLQNSEFRKEWLWPIPKRTRKKGEKGDPAEIFDYGSKYEVPW